MQFPRVSHRFHLILGLLLATAGGLFAQAPVLPDLKPLKEKYDGQKAALFQPLTELEANYRAALDHMKESAHRLGHLETVMAVNEALKDLDAGTLDHPAKASDVEQFRQVYVQQRNVIIRGLVGEVSKAAVDYLEKLRALKLKLSGLERTEDAKTVAKEEEATRKELRALSGDNPLSAPVQRPKLAP